MRHDVPPDQLEHYDLAMWLLGQGATEFCKGTPRASLDYGGFQAIGLAGWDAAQAAFRFHQQSDRNGKVCPHTDPKAVAEWIKRWRGYHNFTVINGQQ
jgi:hypothetical protein